MWRTSVRRLARSLAPAVADLLCQLIGQYMLPILAIALMQLTQCFRLQSANSKISVNRYHKIFTKLLQSACICISPWLNCETPGLCIVMVWLAGPCDCYCFVACRPTITPAGRPQRVEIVPFETDTNCIFRRRPNISSATALSLSLAA